MESKISIVIPTKDRNNQLKRLLASIGASSIQPLEVIIVNNSVHKLNIENRKYKVLDNHTNKGLAQARTFGAINSKGEYVLFVDDDNVLDPNLLEELQQTLDEHADIMAVGPLTYYLSNKKKVWFLKGGINLMTSKASFQRELNNEGNTLYQTDILHNCFLVRKELGDKAQWFDERIFMSGTEFDLFMRIKEVNPSLRLVTDTKARCFHDVPETDKNILRNYGFANELRVYYFQRNRGLLVGRYGSLLHKLSLGCIFYPLFFALYGFLFIYKGKLNFLISHIKATVSGYYYLVTS